MNRNEAIQFLELSPEATNTEIKKTLEDKLLHYEHLIENATSQFLRKLNEQKANQLRSIQEDFQQWGLTDEAPDAMPPAGPASPLSNEETVIEQTAEPETNLTAPVIIAGSKSSIKKGLSKEPAAWLVRHIQDGSSRLLSLFPGKNYIGRKLHPSLKPFLVIEEDDYISRVHAIVYCEEADPFNFYAEDPGAADNLKPSKNGIYINGDEKRIAEKTRLHENDTIQIGVTKFILRLNHSAKKVVLESEKNKFMDTAIVKLPK